MDTLIYTLINTLYPNTNAFRIVRDASGLTVTARDSYGALLYMRHAKTEHSLIHALKCGLELQRAQLSMRFH
jgi:hypothetical protein